MGTRDPIRQAQHEGSSLKRFVKPADIAADYGEEPGRRRARSAGAACILGSQDGRACWRCRRTADRRSATRPTWPIICSTRWATTRPEDAHPARGITTGKTSRRSMDAAYAAGRGRSPSVDQRFPRRSERRHRLRHPAPTTRPGATAMVDGSRTASLDIRQARRLLVAGRMTASSPRRCRHICWDGCMFPNEELTRQQTWNDILAAMISVRDKHGWSE